MYSDMIIPINAEPKKLNTTRCLGEKGATDIADGLDNEMTQTPITPPIIPPYIKFTEFDVCDNIKNKTKIYRIKPNIVRPIFCLLRFVVFIPHR